MTLNNLSDVTARVFATRQSFARTTLRWKQKAQHIPEPARPGVLIVYATLGVASSILIEASLSFLGIGVPVPNPSWGQMIEQGKEYFAIAPWLLFAPGVCLILTVLAFNLAGDWLRDLLDPTAPERR